MNKNGIYIGTSINESLQDLTLNQLTTAKQRCQRRYYLKNQDKLCELARQSFQKIKNDPEKYAAYKEKKRLIYLEKKLKNENNN
jgi:hypothetical protein